MMILYASEPGHLRHTVSIGPRFYHAIGQFLVIFWELERKIASKLRRYVFRT